VPAAQLAAALGEKVYTIGIGNRTALPVCQCSIRQPGSCGSTPNGNVIPTLTLQPANYTVLGKMAALSQANSIGPPIGGNCKALQRY